MQKHCHSHQPTPTEQAGGHVHTKPTDFVVSQGLLAPCSVCALGPRRETQIASVGRHRKRVCTLSPPRSWHVLAGPSFVCSAGHNHLVHHGPCVPVFSCGTTCLRFLAAVAHCVVTQGLRSKHASGVAAAVACNAPRRVRRTSYEKLHVMWVGRGTELSARMPSLDS